ncbi:hypothetical protein [Alloscardovia criceti]|uniref:hypothetical protein n=1 Tax=Alloscardovia criceti TaxID=356828 RepID=UPI0003A15B14|nr:hypothetical protein [Alloscardovia criceti]
MRRKGLARRSLVVWILVCAVLSLVAAMVAPDPNSTDFREYDIRWSVSLGLNILSYTAVPLVAWFVSIRVRRIEQVGEHFQVLLLQYIVALTVLAALCEAPFDYASTGQWWNLSSQNPVWALVISLIGFSVWHGLNRVDPPSRYGLQILVFTAAVVWAVALRTPVGLVVMSFAWTVIPPHFVWRWKKITVYRQLLVILAALISGVTPVLGVWLIQRGAKPSRVRQKKAQGLWGNPLFNQWLLWWSYPVLLWACAGIRLLVMTYGL